MGAPRKPLERLDPLLDHAATSVIRLEPGVDRLVVAYTSGRVSRMGIRKPEDI